MGPSRTAPNPRNETVASSPPRSSLSIAASARRPCVARPNATPATQVAMNPLPPTWSAAVNARNTSPSVPICEHKRPKEHLCDALGPDVLGLGGGRERQHEEGQREPVVQPALDVQRLPDQL